MTKKGHLPYFWIITFAFLFLLPTLLKPSLLLERNNDLHEFFWPMIHFIKLQILENHQIPLWNNLFLSGTPLLSDPQSQIFYLPNVIFLFLPMGTGFLVSFLVHLSWAGIGTYLLGEKLFKDTLSKYFTAFIYLSSFLFFGAMEAGHFGLFNAYAWLPWIALGFFQNSFLLIGISLAMTFFSHPIIFFLSLGLLFFLSLAFKTSRLSTWKGIFISLALSAITLIPQLKWLSLTTRNLLLQNPDVYPKWHSVWEFIKAIFYPNFGSEKGIFLGTGVILLATWGFWKLPRKAKLFLSLIVTGTLLIALNNASPINGFLLKQKPFALLRVATRVWFFVPLAASLLAGYGFDRIGRTQKRNFVKIAIAILVLFEIVFASWRGIVKQTAGRNYAPETVYEFLARDRELFRVFCLNRCLSQRQAAQFDLQLLDGYATLIQTNFYRHSWGLTNSYWNYYSLSVPPIGTYQFEKLQPKASSLAEFNVKYVVSRHQLADKNFNQVEAIDGFLIYENTINLPRAYYLDQNLNPESPAKIIGYSPNLITIDTQDKISNRLVLAEVYSPGWKAYLNGQKEVPVLERPNALRFVNLEDETNFVRFVYDPPGYKIGKIITTLTIFLLVIWATSKNEKLKKIFG